MHCPNCLSEVPDSVKFCASCGKAIPSSMQETMARTPAGTVQSHAVPLVSGADERVESPKRSTLVSQNIGRFPPGSMLAGRYRIIALLGKGGMGEVYRADDLTLDQQVALKFLPEKVGADPGSLGRFHNEVRMARQVSHPNVCRIYDIGQVDHQQFISMEYVDGEDLASSSVASAACPTTRLWRLRSRCVPACRPRMTRVSCTGISSLRTS